MAQGSPPRIFVAVASYRDPDCANTLRDLFEKADAPARVCVGVCLQRDPERDTDCWPVAVRADQCRVDAVHAAESRGACWARARAHALWDGADYVLQIDSHMRFVAGWDTRLLELLAACDSSRPVLSTYPLRFDPPDRFQRDTYVTPVPKAFDAGGALVQKPRSEPMTRAPARPAPSPFLSAGLLFAPAAAFQEVPYDPRLYFVGEEITLAVRLYTHGWDIFVPNKVIAYHDYTRHPVRPRHWEDSGTAAELSATARARLRHLLGMAQSADPEVLAELDRYGLGTARSLAAFARFSGIDFRTRVLRAPYGGDPEAGPEGPAARRHRESHFERLWARAAVRRADTTAVEAELPGLLRFLGAGNLVDAGCGDLAWIAGLTEGLNLYFGYDIAPTAVQAGAGRMAGRPNHAIRAADIVSQDLPAGDVLLCRDTLTELPPDAARAALRRFKAAGSRYLLATTFPRGGNGYIQTGGWQPMNLCAPPFDLPPPRLSIAEGLGGSSKILGVWLLADLPDLS